MGRARFVRGPPSLARTRPETATEIVVSVDRLRVRYGDTSVERPYARTATAHGGAVR